MSLAFLMLLGIVAFPYESFHHHEHEICKISNIHVEELHSECDLCDFVVNDFVELTHFVTAFNTVLLTQFENVDYSIESTKKELNYEGRAPPFLTTS